VFLFPFEDVHTRNHESFLINFRLSPVTTDGTSHLTATLVQGVPADSGNLPWYMTDSVAVLEDSYSKVIMIAIDLTLNWQVFSNVGRPRSFVLLIFSTLLHACVYQLFGVECFCKRVLM